MNRTHCFFYFIFLRFIDHRLQLSLKSLLHWKFRLQGFALYLIAFSFIFGCNKQGFQFEALGHNQSNSNLNINTAGSHDDQSDMEFETYLGGANRIPTPITASTNCAQPHSLPLITHYSKDIGFSLIGTDGVDLGNPLADDQYKGGKELTYFYANHFLPNFNQYLASRFDDVTYPNSKVIELFNSVCQATHTAFRLIQPAIEIKKPMDLLKVIKSDQPYFQVIHSLLFRNNLFTVIIPPGWSKQYRTASYPAIMNGFYGLNPNLIELDGAMMLRILGDHFNINGVGAIGILWNGGGSSSTYTMNDRAYNDLNDFMKLAIPTLKIHSDKIIVDGGSRGGVTALNMASHSAITSFRVRYVRAAGVPSDLDQIASFVGTTMPGLMAASDWITGIGGSWRNDFIYPFGLNNLAGLSGTQARTKILTGEIDETKIRNHFNLTSPEKIENLRNRGTEVFLEIGSHDFIVPSLVQFYLFRTYSKAGIPMEIRINYLTGHWSEHRQRAKAELTALSQASNEIDNPSKTHMIISNQKVNAYILNRSGANPTLYPNVSAHQLPLTIEIPRYLVDAVDSYFFATGQPGKHYRMTFMGPLAADTHHIFFTLDSNGIWSNKVDPKQFSEGKYTMTTVSEIDSSGQVLKVIKLLRSSMPMSEPLAMDRYVGDIRIYGARAETAVMNGIWGSANEYRLRLPSGEMTFTNNGAMEFPPPTGSN